MTLERWEFLRGAAGGLVGHLTAARDRSLSEMVPQVHRPPVVYDVRDFGARGDGVADDGPAIQAAIDAVAGGTGVLGVAPYTRGGIVYIPAASAPYVVGRPLEIAKGLVLTGDGPGSMLYLADGVDAPLLRITHGGDTWVEVSRLSLEGNRFRQTSAESHGIVISASSTLARYHDIFLRLYVRNFRGSGFEFQRGAPHRIVDCTFNDNSISQIHHGPSAIDNYVLNTVVGTDAAESDSIGWWCEGSNNTWTGGAAALSGIGMLIMGLRNAVVGGTSIDSNAHEGIILRTNETRVVGAVIRNNSAAAPGRYDSVVIDGAGGRGLGNVILGCVIDGAHLETEPGDPQARAAIREINGAGENAVSGCVLTRHVEGDIQLSGQGREHDGGL